MTPRPPDYIGIGFRRCASTWLHEALHQHPQIAHYRAGGEAWGAHFFSRDEHYARGFESYCGLFAVPGAEGVVGELSDSYTYPELVEAAARRILRHCPEAKLVCVVRDPVARAWSDYRRSVSRTEIPVRMSFAEALHAEPLLVERGRYAALLAHYAPYIEAGRLHVMLNEDIREDPGQAVAGLYAFLGVDPAFRPSHLQSRVGHAGMARSQWTASLIRSVETRVTPVLRKAGLGPVLDGLARRGVQARIKALCSREARLTARDRALALPLFEDDMAALEAILGVNLGRWRKAGGATA